MMAMAAERDECQYGDLQFKSGEHALQWAEEQLSRLKCRGFYAQMVGGHSGVSWDEIQDCASTIAVTMTEVQDHRGREAYRAIYAQDASAGLDTLIDFVVDHLSRNLAARKRSREYLKAVASVAVMRARQAGQGWRQAPRAAYARELGVDPSTITQAGPQKLIEDAEGAVADWVQRGEREFLDLLRGKGVPV